MTATGDFSIGGEVWPGTSKLVEEMGELSQVLGKLIGSHGQIAHFDGTNLQERLVEEIGDLMGAISFFIEANDLPRTAIFERKIRKYNLFCEWHHNASALAPIEAFGRDPQGLDGEATKAGNSSKTQSGNNNA